MATEFQEQIVREAPDIEARKVGLMDSAKALADATNERALYGEYLTPDYEVAGMSPDQLAALQMGRQGIGAYQPFMTAATQGVTTGSNTLGEAANVLRGADTRGQFGGAQAALNQAAVPIGQMGQSAQLTTQGVPLIGQGAQQFTGAQQALGQGIGALSGAAGMYDPRNVQAFMNPYQQQVIDESIRQINRQGDISRQNLQAQATRAGAFGGSREGVQRAELDRALAEQKNAAIVGGLSQGYQSAAQQAQQAFEQQQGRQLAQGQALGQAASTQGQLGSSLAAVWYWPGHGLGPRFSWHTAGQHRYAERSSCSKRAILGSTGHQLFVQPGVQPAKTSTSRARCFASKHIAAKYAALSAGRLRVRHLQRRSVVVDVQHAASTSGPQPFPTGRWLGHCRCERCGCRIKSRHYLRTNDERRNPQASHVRNASVQGGPGHGHHVRL